MFVAKGAHVVVLTFLQCLLCRLDIDLTGGVGNVSDLRVGRLLLRARDGGSKQNRRQRSDSPDK